MTDPAGTTAARTVVDFSALSSDQRYFFLISAVVPRPIAWVSTRAKDGTTNLAPFSFFQGVSSDPPVVMISISTAKKDGTTKDTLVNVRETGEFAVNLVSEELAEAMVRTSAELPHGESEIEAFGLTPLPTVAIAAGSVAEAKVCLECRLYRELPVGNSVLIFGEVLCAQVAEGLLDARGTIDPVALRPLGRLGGSLYLPFSEPRRIRR
jgi:flavin reductase (DIM6/NTAB) family NADH-FMN oxidoreductase RutF